MLSDDRNEPLETAKDSTVDDDGTRRRPVAGVGGVVSRAILEVEALRQLEVELNGRALERPAERIANLDVDLGAVERAVARVQLPRAREVTVQHARELLFRGIPRFNFPEEVLGTRGELKPELEAKQTVDGLQEVDDSADLFFNL